MSQLLPPGFNRLTAVATGREPMGGSFAAVLRQSFVARIAFRTRDPCSRSFRIACPSGVLAGSC